MDDEYVITPVLGRSPTVETIVVPPPAPAPAPPAPAPAPAPVPVHVPVYETIPAYLPPPPPYVSPTAGSQGPQPMTQILGDPTISSTINYSPHLETNYSQNKSYYIKEGQGGAGAEDWYQYPTQTGEILFDVSGYAQQTLKAIPNPIDPLLTDLEWENQSVLPYSWYQYSTLTGNIGFIDASGNHNLESIQGNLYYDNELLAKANDIQDIADWSLYPALANIAGNGFSIGGVLDVSASGAFTGASVEVTGDISGATLHISGAAEVGSLTSAADISGATLHVSGTATIPDIDLSGCALTSNAAGTALFVNGVEVQTGTPSDASQWATFPAVANVDVNSRSLILNGSLVPPATNSFKLGLPLNPIGINDQYALSTNIYNIAPTGTMNISSNSSMSLLCTSTTGTNEFNISLVGAAGEDMNLTAPDINLTMTDTLSFMNLTAPFGVTVLGGGGFFMLAGAMEVVTGLDIRLITTGNVAIGSGNVGGATTQIEKFEYVDNVVGPMNGTQSLTLNKVRVLNNSIGPDGGDGVMLIDSISRITHTVKNFTTNAKEIKLIIEATGPEGVDNRNITMGNYGTNTDRPFILNFVNKATNTATLTYDTGNLITWTSTGGAVHFAGLGQVDLTGGTGTIALTTNGTQLLVNGVPIDVSGSVALWATFAAVQDIDVSGNDIVNCNDISATSGHFGPLYTNDTNIHLGSTAGSVGQQANSIAIGNAAGVTDQSDNAVAIGPNAGQITQGNRGVAIGLFSGNTNQGARATAVGVGSGFSNQGTGSVAIGRAAGNSFLGTDSVAIGNSASIVGGSFANTVVINATGAALNPAQAGSTYIAPLRETTDTDAAQTSMMRWNSTTKEVSYAPFMYDLQVIATSATSIDLTPRVNGKTFILTGTTTQNFTTTSLTLLDFGFFVIVHNGNASNGGDINLTGMTGTTIIHEQKPTQNGGNVYLFWNGTGLVGY